MVGSKIQINEGGYSQTIRSGAGFFVEAKGMEGAFGAVKFVPQDAGGYELTVQHELMNRFGISIGGGTKFAVQLWGKNITNEKYVSRSVDFGQLGFATAIWGDPATYGIDVEFTF